MDNLSDVEDMLFPKLGSRIATCDRFSCAFKEFPYGTAYADAHRVSMR
jgi:hypothetical protein